MVSDSNTYAASGAIMRLGGPDAIEKFIDIAEADDNRMWVKNAAWAGLRRLTGMDFVGDPAQWRAWWSRNKEDFSRKGKQSR